MIAYKYIISNNIGRKPVQPSKTEEALVETELSSNVNPLRTDSNFKTIYKNDEKDYDVPKSNSSSEYYAAINSSDDKTPLDFIGRYISSEIVNTFLKGRLPPEKLPWAQYLIPYILTVSIVNFNTWGLMTAILPFSMDRSSSSGNGSFNLAIANQVSAFLLFFGDLSTAKFSIPISYGLTVFLVFSITVYMAAISSNEDTFNNDAAGPILITIFCISRFIEANLITSIYRIIAIKFPPDLREEASRSLGFTDQISTTTGAIISTLVVSLS
jgi:hypothetical protein